MKTNRSIKPAQQPNRPVVLTPAEVAAVAGGWGQIRGF